MRIVISGASRGIGLALVKEYAATGGEVLALCRDPDGARELTRVRESRPDVEILRVDVADASSIRDVKSSIGGRPVDLLLNVAGMIRMEKRPEDIDFEAWMACFDVMVAGPFRMTTALLPNLEAAKGKVVSITSQIGASDWAGGGLYSYGAAKAALNRAMKSLAVDLRERGVAVAVVHPGYVKTDMTGLKGDLSTEESAAGIKAVADRLDMQGTGGFFNWNGTPHAW